MARLGRYFLPDQPLHVIQRGNNRQNIFFSDRDREAYLDPVSEFLGSASFWGQSRLIPTRCIFQGSADQLCRGASGKSVI